jgi:hypothetical protein
MKKGILSIFIFVNLTTTLFSVELKYTLLNKTNGTINVLEDIVEIIAFKGNMKFIRKNGEKTNIHTNSPMTTINGLEKLPELKRIELIYQLSCNDLSFLKSATVEYLLLIEPSVNINDINFLQNLPNVHHLYLSAIKYNSTVIDITGHNVSYLFLENIQTNEEMKLYSNNKLIEIINIGNKIDIVNNKLKNYKYITNELYEELGKYFKSNIP